MRYDTTRHPVFRIVMHDQGRSLVWLARQTGFSHAYVKAVSAGIERGSPKFRTACARVLGMAEGDLFHGGDGSNASRSTGTPDAGSSDRAETAGGGRLYARAGGAVKN